jgi:hypothetical protein
MLYSSQEGLSYMEKQSTIAIILAVSIALLAIATSFQSLQQFAQGGGYPSNTGSNMTAGSNMTGPAANTTGGIPSVNPAGHKDNPTQVPVGIPSVNPAGHKDNPTQVPKG